MGNLKWCPSENKWQRLKISYYKHAEKTDAHSNLHRDKVKDFKKKEEAISAFMKCVKNSCAKSWKSNPTWL